MAICTSSSVIDMFPAESVGGHNQSESGAALEIHCGIAEPVFTDIAGDKKIVRKRSWVREFFQAHGLAAGSRVVIEKTGVNRYHIYPVRTRCSKASLPMLGKSGMAGSPSR
jgi:hypothetical protein